MNDQAVDEEPIHTSVRLEDAVAYRIHRTNRLLLTHLSRFLRTLEPQLTPEKWFIIAKLHEVGTVPQVELTEPALVDAPNVSRLVESLVQAGLVLRISDEQDRRVKIICLSDEGQAFAKEALAATIKERMRLFESFDDGHLAALTTALDQLDDAVRSRLLGALD